jgi:hypothetical protein
LQRKVNWSLYQSTGVWESTDLKEIIAEMESGTKILIIHNCAIGQDKIDSLLAAGYSVSITPISTIVSQPGSLT